MAVQAKQYRLVETTLGKYFGKSKNLNIFVQIIIVFKYNDDVFSN